ncbi:Molybdate-binding periplasmic protein precursor [Pelotomaculum schinkii]|uniref:Molybdate-binding periplasmic protein n=1 Tax=Pelotomaculum schinkii TaxID=78350 RepID=A0A4Y7R7G2_9FIRM|nr:MULTISPECIES: molybdate ABC transporter substrate-binding protein [Pelotomaculum]TEB04560.1 Molybdate-binding periplasmic protein precursor [Pelotomaculum schinkii]TEB15041.1 Molybdate-binding periplasmic protein precursor [Pelotomaculum sp. FP]
MKKILIFLALMLFVVAAVTGCGGEKEQPKTELNVSAAASLTDAAGELKTIYEKQHSDVTITYNLAASGTLQKQIEEGAPADLFISAGKSQMDALAQKGLIVDASRKDLLGNELVLIAGKDSKLTEFNGMTDASVEKISIGTPETVPAGKYAKDTLTALKLWEQLEPKMVLAKDVRQVLTYVETGNVDAGLVYRTDAATSNNVKIVAAAPAGSSAPVVYPMAVIKSTKHQKEAEAFAAFLTSDDAVKVFEKYGFKVLK